MDLHDLDERIDVAGHLPTAINAAAEKLITAGKISALDLAPLLAPLAGMRDALISIQEWSTAAQKTPAPPAQTPPPPPAAPSLWDMYRGMRDASSLSADDMRFVIATSSAGAQAREAWFDLIGGDVRNAWQRAAEGSGLNKFDAAVYIAANGPLVQAYRAAGGKV